MLARSESMNYVTSCHQVESCVLCVKVGDVWDSLKTLSWEKVFSSHVKSIKFTSGSPYEIGSTFEVEYKDGSVWTNRIIELSERRRVIAWELIGATPNISFTSMMVSVKLFEVTENNSTYISWETDYSNDVNAHIVQDGKYKKLDYFKDLKKYFCVEKK